MKQSKHHRKEVCMLCGKPSQERICELCKAKIHGETLHKKIHNEKGK